MPEELLLRNCRLYDSADENERVDILIRDGRIDQIGEMEQPGSQRNHLEVEGRIIAPGFIDIHIQGAGGADVLDGTVESLQTISKTLSQLGTTSFLATTVVKPDLNNQHIKVAAENVGVDLGGANILGLHLEGPFINPRNRGGVSRRSIFPPSMQKLEDILSIAEHNLRIMTMAPELRGSMDIVRGIVDRGIVASLGHSNASYEETLGGFDAGISHVTHIFNAMPSLHHRKPGPLLAIFESDQVTVQIISDGVHLHPDIVKFLYRTIGEQRCICITDGIQAMGMPEGTYVYDGREYESKEGTARYRDGTLIGTALGAGEIALRFMEFTDCSLETAIRTITRNPAQLLGIDDKKGSIEVGKDADIVVMDFDYSIWTTVINGRIVYRK